MGPLEAGASPGGMRSRTAVLRSSIFLQHDTGDHPERAARITAIDREIDRLDLAADRPELAFGPATDEAILRVHTPAYLERLTSIASSGGGWIDADTVVRPESIHVARMAAGASVSAGDALLANRIDRAFVISRPPGHHATPNRAMGFCLLNAVAIAAAHAIAQGLRRVSILDWDVHHGNGTQDAFYGRRDIQFCSLHQSPHYPGTGDRNETGSGKGRGFTINLPMSAGSGDDAYLELLRSVAIPAIDAFEPELLVVSAGFDAHTHDPLGGMRVTGDGFDAMMSEAVLLANRHGGKVLAVLEGGYDAAALARGVTGAISVLDRTP